MNNKYIFFIVSIFSLAVVFLSKNMIETDSLLMTSLSEQYTQIQINELMSSQKEWQWVTYIILPLIILLRSSLVALCLSIGCFLFNIEEDTEIKFKQFLRISLIGEVVFLSANLIKLFWFAYVEVDYTYEKIQTFYPLSIMNVMNVENIDNWLLYPLQTLNLFEFIYWFVLAYGVKELLKDSLWKSFKLTIASYGTGLVIWVVAIMFVTLNMS